jgi:hypothetical protein
VTLRIRGQAGEQSDSQAGDRDLVMRTSPEEDVFDEGGDREEREDEGQELAIQNVTGRKPHWRRVAEDCTLTSP